MIENNYCTNCILPETRPNMFFDKKKNLCSVCINLKIKKKKNKLEKKKKRIFKNNRKSKKKEF